MSNWWYRGIELFKCVYLASMGVKIEHTVGVQNKVFFQNAYLMVMSTETLAAAKVKIAKIYALVRRNLMIYMENLIKLNFVTNSVVFDL